MILVPFSQYLATSVDHMMPVKIWANDQAYGAEPKEFWLQPPMNPPWRMIMSPSSVDS